MASELKGLRVAFLTSNEGVEQVELTAAWDAVRSAGGDWADAEVQVCTAGLTAPKPGQNDR